MNPEVYITYNKDAQGNRISVERTWQTYVVYNNKITLNEIPDPFYGVELSDNTGSLVEVKNGSHELKEDQYYVDYSTGAIFFNQAKEGYTITANSYYGIGFVSYPVDRIYTKKDGGEVTETLQDVLDASVKEFKFSKEEPPQDASQYKEGTVWMVYE